MCLISFKDFLFKTIGKEIDFDKYAGAQCVDLIRQGIKVMYGCPQPEPTGDEGAMTFFTKHENRPIQKRFFNRFSINTGQHIPEGSIVIFKNTGNNPYGHIGFCVRTEGNIIYLFEQDGLSRDRSAKVKAWNYENVLGYLVKNDILNR